VNRKACDKCGKVKPLDKFHKVNGAVDGRRNKCISCRNEERQVRRIHAGPSLPPERVVPSLYQLLFEPEEWKDSAACAGDSAVRDYSGYFPGPEGQTSRVEMTRNEKCVVCPVAFECLEYSIKIEAADGLWGGMYGNERRRFINQTNMKDRQAKRKHAAFLNDLRDRLEAKASA
jgi:Transcription factor WhiB